MADQHTRWLVTRPCRLPGTRVTLTPGRVLGHMTVAQVAAVNARHRGALVQRVPARERGTP